MAASLALASGDDHARNFLLAGLDRDGERRACRECHHRVRVRRRRTVGHFFFGEADVGSDDAEGHGEVESGNFFLDVGGCEIDGDVGGRDVVAAVLERGADAIAAFADGSVGQVDGVEVILVALDAGAVDFDLNNVGVDVVDRGAESFVEHGAGSVKSPRFSQRTRETGHPDTRVPDSYSRGRSSSLAVTDVTRGCGKGM